MTAPGHLSKSVSASSRLRSQQQALKLNVNIAQVPVRRVSQRLLLALSITSHVLKIAGIAFAKNHAHLQCSMCDQPQAIPLDADRLCYVVYLNIRKYTRSIWRDPPDHGHGHGVKLTKLMTLAIKFGKFCTDARGTMLVMPVTCICCLQRLLNICPLQDGLTICHIVDEAQTI